MRPASFLNRATGVHPASGARLEPGLPHRAFMPAQRFGFEFVVEEVKKAFERAKIRNVKFTPLDQFERSWAI